MLIGESFIGVFFIFPLKKDKAPEKRFTNTENEMMQYEKLMSNVNSSGWELQSVIS